MSSPVDASEPAIATDAAGTPPRRPLPGRLVYLVCAGVAAIWLLLDQATKVIAVETLQGRGVVDAGLGGVLEWELVRNTNAAFNIPGFTGMFVVVSIVVVLVVSRALPRTERLSLAFAYGLVTGGALGNLVDRLFREPGFPDGGVVDFIKIGWWPKFNLADSGIVVGALLIMVLMFLVDREERARERAGIGRESVRPDATGPRG
jgi:signal peptidase II